MNDSVFTETFKVISIPKPVKPKKAYHWNSSIPISKKKKNLRNRPKLHKIKRKRLPSVKSLKVKADKLFSLYIRGRDKYTCVLCGSKTNVQNGHLVKRGKMSVRYDEKNCHALCKYHNYLDNYDHDIYVNWFINKYGQKEYKKLFELSRKIKQFKRVDYEEIIKKYSY